MISVGCLRGSELRIKMMCRASVYFYRILTSKELLSQYRKTGKDPLRVCTSVIKPNESTKIMRSDKLRKSCEVSQFYDPIETSGEYLKEVRNGMHVIYSLGYPPITI